jgi:ribonuclease P protein component
VAAKFWQRAVRRVVIASRPFKTSEGAPLGFSRAARLVRRSEFETVYRGGGRKSSAQFVVFYRANGGERSRYGISVKKALGGAVIRNRIRRRIREILRRNSSEISPGWDIVIHPRSAMTRTAFASIEAELLGLLRNIR